MPNIILWDSLIKHIFFSFFYRYYLIGNNYLYVNAPDSDDNAILYFNKARIVLENQLQKSMNSEVVKVI